MKIDGVGNLCLWCMEDMGNGPCCPYCGHDERIPQRAEQAIPAGQIIGGHYLLGRTLGQGGFGITYLAYDLDLQIKRAIKEYFPQGLAMREGNTVQVTRQSVAEIYQKGVDSFYREAQSIARFGGHSNVVQVHAFFRENNTAYFVMDYVEGISFQQYLEDRGGRISWEEALRILKPIGEALTALHESRLLHRDVKPDNIFITRNGTPKLLDFGAARYETSESTHSSATVLTPGYAPGEQYGSMSRQGTFTDVYALSATFYRAVSGFVPIPAPDRMEEDPLISLDKVDGLIPAGIGAAISRGMGVHRENRTQTVAQLLKELESPSPRKSASKLPKWLLPVIAAVLVLGVGLKMLISVPQKKDGNPTEEVPAAVTTEITLEPVENQTQEAIALQETKAAETEAASFSEREQQAAETEAALVAAMEKDSEIPTATAEPTVNRTEEVIALRETNVAETQNAWQSLMETETARPTATKTPEPTSTPKPTATATEKVQGVITDEIRNAQAGDRVYYGQYEQDNDLSNGPETIEWRVLAREGDRLLLLSEVVLDAQPYNMELAAITWENSTLRKWLNEDFYQNAFSEEEQRQISLTDVSAEANPDYATNTGGDTQDKVFLLNIQEANLYFKEDLDRRAKVSPYAEENGVYNYAEYDGTAWWWLRSPGDRENRAAYVNADGSVYTIGSYVYHDYGSVRPALWLNL